MMRDEARVLVCGGRNYRNQGLVNETLNKMRKDFGIDLIIRVVQMGLIIWLKRGRKKTAYLALKWKQIGAITDRQQGQEGIYGC